MYTTSVGFTDFTELLHQILKTEEFIKLKNKRFICYKLAYPPISRWKLPSATFLKSLNDDIKDQLRKQHIYYILDCSSEGYDPTSDTCPFFKILYKDCIDLGISPSSIIYVSSNLRDEENFKQWIRTCNLTEHINVVSYNKFTSCTINDLKKEISLDMSEDPQESFSVNEKMFNDLYDGKFFTSLSRRSRKWRTIGQFILSTQDFSQYGLFSQDNQKSEQFEIYAKGLDIDKDAFFKWRKKLPMSVDRKDFYNNWVNYNFGQLYNQTVFHVCNETLQDTEKNTRLFFTEKTFKPMKLFQPFVIWGQPGANKFLETMGFKTYEGWFDLSFDSIEDNLLRLKGLTQSVSEVCKELSCMSKPQQIAWRFKFKEVLLHNYSTLLNREWDRNRIRTFLQELELKL